MSTLNVRTMYEAYPYPSPQADEPIQAVVDIMNAWFKGDNFSGQNILEAGCGSGHRLVGVAQRYPGAKVLGVDISRTSLQVGSKLADKHRVSNMIFQEGNLLDLSLDDDYDFILCTGVLHHTENPSLSLQNICTHLAENGSIFVWVYHPFGEHERLLERELLCRLWVEGRGDFSKGVELINQLAFNLDHHQYSGDELCPVGQNSQITEAGIAKNVDAYLNPIVHAYRTEQALALFADCNVDWIAVEGFSTIGAYKPINLSGMESETSRDFFQVVSNTELFQSPTLLGYFEKLDTLDKLAVMELMIRPTGIGIVAGKGDSYKKYPRRIEGNLVEPAVSPRLSSNYLVKTSDLTHAKAL